MIKTPVTVKPPLVPLDQILEIKSGNFYVSTLKPLTKKIEERKKKKKKNISPVTLFPTIHSCFSLGHVHVTLYRWEKRPDRIRLVGE